VRAFRWLAAGTAAAVYAQIVLGAQLRHPGPEMDPQWFRLWVWLHVLLAIGLIVPAVVLRSLARRLGRDDSEPVAQPMVALRAGWFLALYPVQIALGLAAWITHYNWPQWFARSVSDIDYTIISGGRLQGVLTTAHVAVGSLMLVTALSMVWWSQRRLAAVEPSNIP
jgi:cytochrome c oxidase assembly protein subunit 15